MRLSALLFVILFFSLAYTQQEAQPVVDEIAVCTAVENKAPVAADTSFAADIGTLYCYTKVTGAGADSSVSHVWYHNDQEMARIKLNVRADAWRTWSSKSILPEWTGKWRVDVESVTGMVLASRAFLIEEAARQ